MKIETFINKLLSIGFIQNFNDGISAWYGNHSNGAMTAVGIRGGIITIIRENEEIDFEKDYFTYSGAWRSIQKLI